MLQFYFPFVLPRADDWTKIVLDFQLPDFKVEVRPRGLDDELFPDDVDKTLSSMDLRLSRISLPTSAVSLRVQDRCHDRIEVRVHGVRASAEEVARAHVQERFLDIAIRICSNFLYHCRMVGRAPFITGLERHYRLKDGYQPILNPYTISWFRGEDGQRLPAYDGVNAQASSGAIQTPERGSVSMESILKSLRIDEQPSLPQSLLVDAEMHVRTQRLREAILALGTACEVASDEHLRRSGRANESRVGKILASKKASFAEKRFHLLPEFLVGRSMKREDRTAFELVENTYRTRNSLAHSGQLRYRVAQSWVKVDVPLAAKFLAASERAVAWLATP